MGIFDVRCIFTSTSDRICDLGSDLREYLVEISPYIIAPDGWTTLSPDVCAHVEHVAGSLGQSFVIKVTLVSDQIRIPLPDGDELSQIILDFLERTREVSTT